MENNNPDNTDKPDTNKEKVNPNETTKDKHPNLRKDSDSNSTTKELKEGRSDEISGTKDYDENPHGTKIKGNDIYLSDSKPSKHKIRINAIKI